MDRGPAGGTAPPVPHSPPPPFPVRNEPGGPGEGTRGAGLRELPVGAPLTWLPAVGAAAVPGAGGPLQLQQQRLVAVAVHHRRSLPGAELCGSLSTGREMRNWRAAPERRGAPSPPAPPGRALPGRPSATSWRRLLGRGHHGEREHARLGPRDGVRRGREGRAPRHRPLRRDEP